MLISLLSISAFPTSSFYFLFGQNSSTSVSFKECLPYKSCAYTIWMRMRELIGCLVIQFIFSIFIYSNKCFTDFFSFLYFCYVRIGIFWRVILFKWMINWSCSSSIHKMRWNLCVQVRSIVATLRMDNRNENCWWKCHLMTRTWNISNAITLSISHILNFIVIPPTIHPPFLKCF